MILAESLVEETASVKACLLHLPECTTRVEHDGTPSCNGVVANLGGL